jgi:serine/threonine protein kinase
VAVKVIQPTVFKADEASQAFKEALVLQNLKHREIIKLYNVFQLADTRIVLFMEYIKGGTLRDYL